MAVAEFAKKQLEKFGWKEGEGLGKSGRGIVEPVKVKLKRDTVGVGYSPVTEDKVFWWASCYNRAANSLSVSNTEDSVRISSDQDERSHISRRYSSSHCESLVHRRFLPSTVTHCGGREEKKEGEEREERGEGEGEGRDRYADTFTTQKPDDKNIWRISDRELLKACGGRTGHKAARHGLRLSGKLRRLEAQDELHRVSLGSKLKKRRNRTKRT